MLKDHAAYTASRLKALRQHKRFILTAASQAQRAADFLHGLQLEKTEGPQADDFGEAA